MDVKKYIKYEKKTFPAFKLSAKSHAYSEEWPLVSAKSHAYSEERPLVS